MRIANVMGVSVDSLLGRTEFEPVQVPAANAVTIDITNLTSEQRRIIQQTVKIFEAYNQSQKRGE